MYVGAEWQLVALMFAVRSDRCVILDPCSSRRYCKTLHSRKYHVCEAGLNLIIIEIVSSLYLTSEAKYCLFRFV